MMDSDFGDPPENALPAQSLLESFVLADNSNADNSTVSDELFSCLISTSAESHSSAGGQTKEFYQCRRCSKHFGRLDHVKRHCRTREFWSLHSFVPGMELALLF